MRASRQIVVTRIGAMVLALSSAALLAPARATAAAAPFYSDGEGTTPEIRESIELCAAIDVRPPHQHAAMIERGLALAEAAAARRPDDARAHFALFCHVARKTERAGLSTAALSAVARMREELDRALELEPLYLDALVGKAMLLIKLPWLLGGDEDRGEELLRQAIALDAGFTPARERLAAFLADEGRTDEMPEVRLARHAAGPEA